MSFFFLKTNILSNYFIFLRIFFPSEKSVLSITLEDQNTNEILAIGCFNDYPNVYGVSPKNWEEWLNSTYSANKNNSLNTLFMHFFVTRKDFSIACANELIKSAFKAVAECHYILLCMPHNIPPEPSLINIFSEMKKNENANISKTKYSVFCVNRERCIPVLHVRDSR